MFWGKMRFCRGGLLLLFLTELTTLTTVDGVKQELFMHMQEGYIFYFDSSFRNFSPPAQIAPFNKICGIGRWRLFENDDFTSFAAVGGSLESTNLTCTTYDLETSLKTNIRSIRPLAGSDTEKASISLYPEVDWEGEELLFQGDSLNNISMEGVGPVRSFVATDTSDWTLYEGANFSGMSTCFKNNNATRKFYWARNLQVDHAMSTVGSVQRGCKA